MLFDYSCLMSIKNAECTFHGRLSQPYKDVFVATHLPYRRLWSMPTLVIFHFILCYLWYWTEPLLQYSILWEGIWLKVSKSGLPSHQSSPVRHGYCRWQWIIVHSSNWQAASALFPGSCCKGEATTHVGPSPYNLTTHGYLSKPCTSLFWPAYQHNNHTLLKLKANSPMGISFRRTFIRRLARHMWVISICGRDETQKRCTTITINYSVVNLTERC